MKAIVTVDGVIRALAEELAAALGGRLGGLAAHALGEFAPDAGWLASVELRGAAQGRASVWFGRESAAELASLTMKTSAPGDDLVAAWLRELFGRALAAIASRPGLGDLEAGDVNVGAGTAPAGAQSFELSIGDKGVGVLVVMALLTASASGLAPGDPRLEAVLDVDLPLVVRFGRAVLPLRALVDLGPGSVVDMGRSPDEPVELVVGERVIARGEVVIVAGNYGVRITELMNGARQESDQEARA
jgi:flagellar motor switch protein FliN